MGSGGTTVLLSPGRGWRVAGHFGKSGQDVRALAEGSAYGSATLSEGGKKSHERLLQGFKRVEAKGFPDYLRRNLR